MNVPSKRGSYNIGSNNSHYRHGLRQSPEYRVWANMKKRCLDPNSTYYKHYGGRGIQVCDRWLDFVNFYKDMGARPQGLTLDRIDNDGNYEPSNCRWATASVQAINTRTKGVRKLPSGKYQARVRQQSIGTFTSVRDAINAVVNYRNNLIRSITNERT